MLQLVQAYRYENFSTSPLRKFLLTRALRHELIAFSLHWHVKLEKENDENGQEMVGHYAKLYDDLMHNIKRDARHIFDNLLLQIDFRAQLYELSIKLKESKKDKFEQKKKNMRTLVSSEGKFDMRQLNPPRPCPIKPSLYLKGVLAERSTLFQSAMCPLKLDFDCVERQDGSGGSGTVYSLIYKHGDDVRQDQLVLQIISLMDGLL